jgi:CRISPR-associated endonuclease/helicase Cas3
MLGRPATTRTVDLAQFELGGDRSCTQTVLGLRDRYGPFVPRLFMSPGSPR